MPAKLYIFIVVSLLCCEFSEENSQEASSENKKQDQEESSEVENDEFVSSVEDDNEEATALKLVPAPDLTKEKERKKGTHKYRHNAWQFFCDLSPYPFYSANDFALFLFYFFKLS